MKLLNVFLLSFIVVLSLIWLIFLIDFSQEVIYKSYLSFKLDCAYLEEPELDKLGYYIAGSYLPSNDSISYYNSCGEEIEPIETDYSVILHENCHKRQHELNISHSCSNLIGKYFDEFTCYFLEYIN